MRVREPERTWNFVAAIGKGPISEVEYEPDSCRYTAHNDDSSLNSGVDGKSDAVAFNLLVNVRKDAQPLALHP